MKKNCKHKLKIKKAVNGLQYVNTEAHKATAYESELDTKQQAGATLGAAGIGAVGNAFGVPHLDKAAMAIDGVSTALTKNKEGEYKSQFAKSADALYNPLNRFKALASGNKRDIVDSFSLGLGSKVTDAVGINLGEGSEDINKRLKQQAKTAEKANTFNDTYDQQDLSSFQGKQYKSGAKKLKTKVIEIEGKQTPEIHTDKNFNLKNLGTTPHSKGGNKVLAEEGDVVFPTQNSPKKYNEIITAIMNKDKYKLKKEQAKLPEDKNPKYDNGTKKVKGKKKPEPINPFADIPSIWKDTKSTLSYLDKNIDRANPKADPNFLKTSKQTKANAKVENKEDKGTNNPSGRKVGTSGNTKSGGKSIVSPPSFPTSGKVTNPDEILNTYVGNKGHNVAVGRAGTGDIQTVKARQKDVKGSYNKEANDAAREGLLSGKYQVVKGKDSGNADAEYPWDYYVDDRGVGYQYHGEQIGSKVEVPETTITPKQEVVAKEHSYDDGKEFVPKEKKKFKFNADDALEYAPVAYKLGQGLFGKTEKVDRRYFNPELERYTDTSEPLRREVNSQHAQGKANASNLVKTAQGRLSNLQSMSNSRLNHMTNINNSEYGKQVDINNRNTQTINNGKLTNLDLAVKYDDLDAQNRAKKQEALSSGIEDLGAIGSRNKLMKNNLQATQITANAMIKGGNYGHNPVTQGTQISEWDTGFRQGSGGLGYPSLGVQVGKKEEVEKEAKGSKGIKVNRKYKLRK